MDEETEAWEANSFSRQIDCYPTAAGLEAGCLMPSCLWFSTSSISAGLGAGEQGSGAEPHPDCEGQGPGPDFSGLFLALPVVESQDFLGTENFLFLKQTLGLSAQCKDKSLVLFWILLSTLQLKILTTLPWKSRITGDCMELEVAEGSASGCGVEVRTPLLAGSDIVAITRWSSYEERSTDMHE